MLNINTTKLPTTDRVVPFCKVIAMTGTGARFITVQMPGADGARINAWYTGSPYDLAVNDYVRIQRQGVDKRYVVVGYDQTGLDIAGETVKVSSNDTTPGYLNGKLVAGDNITLTENNDGSNETLTIVASGGGIGQNLLYDSLFSDASFPESTSSASKADDSYFNLWNVVHNAATGPTLSRQAGGASDPFEYYMRCAIATNAIRAGVIQFLGAADSKALRGSPASVSFDIWSPTIAGMRASIVEWAGTADTLTSDIVSDWTDADPTLATNWSYITGNPGASFTVTSSLTRVTIEGLTVGSSVNNLALFVWTGTEDSGEYFNIARVKLEPSATATDFVPRPLGEEKQRISDVLEVFGGDTANERLFFGQNISTTQAIIHWAYQPKFRIPAISSPDATLWSLSTNVGGLSALTSISFAAISRRASAITATVSGGQAAGNATLFLSNSINARIIVSARL